MAVAVVRSRALAGASAPCVVVEVHLAGGLPAFNLVGLPEAEVREARDRVRAALQNAQYEFPARKITVNLAPADLPKESGRFDLPIALGVLAATGQLPQPAAGCARVRGRARADRRAAADPRCARDGARRAQRRSSVRPAAGVGRRGRAGAGHDRSSGALAARRLRASRRPDDAAAGRLRCARRTDDRVRARRRSRAGAREARACDRRSRRTLAVARRSAGHGQVDACATTARIVAAVERRRGARDCGARLARRPLRPATVPRAAVSRAASHGQRRGHRRRGQHAEARGDLARASRRAVPRRVAGVGSPRARGACASRSKPASSTSRAQRGT